MEEYDFISIDFLEDENAACPASHKLLHIRVAEIEKEGDRYLRGTSISSMIGGIKIEARMAMECGKALYVYRALRYTKAVITELINGMKEERILKKEVLEVTEILLAEFLMAAHFEIFVMDMRDDVPSSCLLTQKINEAACDILKLVTNLQYGQFFSGSFDEHLRRIQSGKLDVPDYMIVVAFHNVRSCINEIAAERRISDRSSDLFYLDFDYLQESQKFLLTKTVKDELVESSVIHATFFNLSSLLPESVKIEWRNRVSMASSHFAHSCECCTTFFSSKSSIGVMSGCSCNICIKCLDSFVYQQSDIKCPNCGVLSEDYIPATGYNNIASMLVEDSKIAIKRKLEDDVTHENIENKKKRRIWKDKNRKKSKLIFNDHNR